MEGRGVVVTGGASGIGEATARLLVDAGARVVVADVDVDRGKALVDELGAPARFVRTDVTIDADIRSAVHRAITDFGRLDVMFNNAGHPGRWQPLEDVDVDEWDRMFALLTRSVFLGIKHAAGAMVSGGSIVNTASVAALQSGYGPHPYSAAKAAVIQLTRTAAVELAPRRIRVNAVIPGGIATRITGAPPDVMRRGLDAFQPYPRVGEASDIAEVVLFLASDRSEFITGETIKVDGGLLAGKPMPAMSRRSGSTGP